MKRLSQRFTPAWFAVCLAALAATAGAADVRSLTELKSGVESLRKTDVAWREVRWKTCLLDGLSESRRTGKPLMLWIFIDRPIDDERC